jgi:hypothetical protein
MQTALGGVITLILLAGTHRRMAEPARTKGSGEEPAEQAMAHRMDHSKFAAKAGAPRPAVDDQTNVMGKAWHAERDPPGGRKEPWQAFGFQL